MKRILLTGGGSGGHIFPLIAVARKLKQYQLCYYGPQSIYNDYLKKEGVETRTIISAKLRRYFSLWNLADIPKFFFSIIQALFKIYWYMPDVAFSKGGPGALPVLIACRFYRVPIIIHESDTVPGLTNKITGRWAKIIELGWDKAVEFFPQKDCRVVGIPINESILSKLNINQQGAKESFDFNINEPVILVVGGSLGSQRINDFLMANLEKFLAKYQILHQTGSNNYEAVTNLYNFISKDFSNESKERYKAWAFFEKNIAEAYAAADLIISRAGASAIAEISAFGKPAILVPLPESASDHQRVNAYEYAKNGAAVVIEEGSLMPDLVLAQIDKILGNKELGSKMSTAAKSFAKTDAAEKIASDITGTF